VSAVDPLDVAATQGRNAALYDVALSRRNMLARQIANDVAAGESLRVELVEQYREACTDLVRMRAVYVESLPGIRTGTVPNS
jgi:hypothetical protein